MLELSIGEKYHIVFEKLGNCHLRCFGVMKDHRLECVRGLHPGRDFSLPLPQKCKRGHNQSRLTRWVAGGAGKYQG